jgi:hypothetical protein
VDVSNNIVSHGFHNFAKYLRAKAPGEKQLTELKGARGCGGCLLPIAVFPIMIGLASETLALVIAGIGLAAIGGISVIVTATKMKRLAEAKRLVATAEGSVMLDEAIWMQEQRQLESRCHPLLVPQLEACATAWTRVVQSLSSPKWTERAKEPSFADLRKSTLEAVDSAMLDALWASRDLVRRKGMRKVVFDALCADQNHGQQALLRIASIREEMEELANHVSDEVYTHPLEQSAIRRVLGELKLVHEAENELERDVPRLQE